jgi:RHS repeat-associated protein
MTYSYDSWGKQLTCTGSLASTLGAANPLRYRGYIYDSETGLYYLQSRYYNPEWGRFINEDDVGTLGASNLINQNNLFSYCRNNPIMLSDPTGFGAISTLFDILLIFTSFTPFAMWLKLVILGLYIVRFALALAELLKYKRLFINGKITANEWIYQQGLFVFTVVLIVIGALATLASAPASFMAQSVWRIVATVICRVWGTAAAAALLAIDYLKNADFSRIMPFTTKMVIS